VVWSDGQGSLLRLMQRSEETGVQIELGRRVGVYSDPAVQGIAYPDGRRRGRGVAGATRPDSRDPLS
jgi:hypothetical protein